MSSSNENQQSNERLLKSLEWEVVDEKVAEEIREAIRIQDQLGWKLTKRIPTSDGGVFEVYEPVDWPEQSN